MKRCSRGQQTLRRINPRDHYLQKQKIIKIRKVSTVAL